MSVFSTVSALLYAAQDFVLLQEVIAKLNRAMAARAKIFLFIVYFSNKSSLSTRPETFPNVLYYTLLLASRLRFILTISTYLNRSKT